MAYTFAWDNLPRPFAALSPMVGVTDSAFRQICKGYGADVLFTEMVSSEALMRSRRINLRTARMLEFRRDRPAGDLSAYGRRPRYYGAGGGASGRGRVRRYRHQYGLPRKIHQRQRLWLVVAQHARSSGANRQGGAWRDLDPAIGQDARGRDRQRPARFRQADGSGGRGSANRSPAHKGARLQGRGRLGHHSSGRRSRLLCR